MSSGSPSFTVVTPSLNQAQFLERSIRSVVDQGYPDLEYFVADAGSSDGSVDIIERYGDRIV
jgi:glycosyltransferase involved in cell wall biosynthesis